MKSALLLSILCLLLFACSKINDKSTLHNQLLWEYNDSLFLDSATVAAQLTGSWQLVQQRLSYNGEVIMAANIVMVTFNPNFTFTVVENSAVTAQGSWKLYPFAAGKWALDLSAPNSYLYGFISFYNNQVLFTDSWLDGNDNLFKKTD